MDSLLNTYLTLLKMSENNPRYDCMLFNYETTMKTDYRNGALLKSKRTIYQEKPKCLKVRPPPLKDIHTMTDWKTPHIPIDLLVKPKEVVRTDPRKIQEPYKKLEDPDKNQVRATRPRIVMTPAVSIDDIQDKRLYSLDGQQELIIKETYTSSTKLAMIHGIPFKDYSKSLKAPLREKPSVSKPVSIAKLQFPYISPEWRMQSVSWDSRQLRSYCDPDRDFYLARTPRCNVCAETAARKRSRRIQ